MPFALDSSPELNEISEALNYLLANFGANIAADPNTGQISGPSGIVVAYLYKYIAIKYADSFDGSSGFSDSPTDKEYYGVNNSNSSVESTNPADYIWYKVAGGGFGTTKFLFYQVAGGRQINFVVDTVAPDDTYLQAGTSAIDLDVITTATAYQNASPTIYQWTTSSTAPARPTTTTTYYWNTGVYTAPAGWSTTIPVNTASDYYLWAITIPLTVVSTTATSILDWTSTSYPIYVDSKNGGTGPTGPSGATGPTGAGTPGATGPRSSFIYFYYNTAQSSAPTAPLSSEVSYNFSTRSATITTAGWSSSFSPSALSTVSANNKYYAISVVFSEVTYGGSQNTPVITGPFTWENFNGLVTFTNLSSGQDATGAVTTYIDGGTIITDTLVVDRIKNNTSGIFNGVGTFGLGTNSSVGPYRGAGAFTSGSYSLFGVVSGNTGGGNALGGGTVASNSSFTGTIFNGASGIFTASISGNVMTVTSMLGGVIYPGTTLAGVGVTSGTIVVAYITGSGGTGTYYVSISQTASSGTKGTSGAYLEVSSIASGSVSIGSLVSGAGVAANTIIVGFSSGTLGGVGTYIVNINQAVSSQAMTGTNSSAGVTGVGYGNSTLSTYKNQGSIGTSDSGGTFQTGGASNLQSATTADIRLAYYTGGVSYSYYIYSGTAHPFTAGHDALQLLTEAEPSIGDLMVDVELISAPTVSDCITQMTVSTSANQNGVIGVYTGQTAAGFVPAALADYVEAPDGTVTQVQLKPEYANIYETYRCIGVNAIGEGKINVCGQNGDIAIGDFIVASDTAGKGMKQSDDVFHSYTVAKARENVTFSSPTEVKQIACIYMGG